MALIVWKHILVPNALCWITCHQMYVYFFLTFNRLEQERFELRKVVLHGDAWLAMRQSRPRAKARHVINLCEALWTKKRCLWSFVDQGSRHALNLSCLRACFATSEILLMLAWLATRELRKVKLCWACHFIFFFNGNVSSRSRCYRRSRVETTSCK